MAKRKYTPKQLEAIKIIYEVTKGKDEVTLNEFKNDVVRAKLKCPWKILDEYKTGGSFRFHELYGDAGILNMVENVPHEDIKTADVFEKFEEKTEDTPEQDQTASRIEPKKDSGKPNTIASTKDKSIPESKLKQFTDPVIIVESVDSAGTWTFVGVTRNFDRAWDKLKYRAIHDHGNKEKEEARYELDTTGKTVVISSVCNTLLCVMTKTELE